MTLASATFRETSFKQSVLISTDHTAEEVSIVTIFNNPPKALSKKPIKIMSTQKIAPIIITVPGPLPYTSDKAVPWHYGADVYVLGVKQKFDTSTSVSNITGPAKITRSGRLFSPDISPPVIQKPLIITPASVHVSLPNQVPVSTPATESSNARGKGLAPPMIPTITLTGIS